MQSFHQASTWSQESSGVLGAHLDSGWTQGRAIFGGVLMAGALRGLANLVPEGRRLRSVTASFMAPVRPEPFVCRLEVLRSGSSFTHTHARIVQGEQVCVDISAGFGADRPPGIVVSVGPPPECQAPDAQLKMPYVRGITPEFIRHFEVVMEPEYRPYSGRAEPGMRCWLREAGPTGPFDAIHWVAMLDTPPPPVWAMLTRPAMGSTIHFQATVLGNETGELPHQWALFQSQVNASDGAYCDYRSVLWGEDGCPLALGKQIFADFSGVKR